MGFLGGPVVTNLPAMQETWVRSLGWEDPLEKGMATHSSTLAWRIPWTEEPGGLQSTGSQRVRHGRVTNTHTKYKYSHLEGLWNSFSIKKIFLKINLFLTVLGLCWRRQWHPTPVLLPGKSHGRRSLVGCSPWGC